MTSFTWQHCSQVINAKEEPSNAFAAWPSGQVADALSGNGAVARQIRQDILKHSGTASAKNCWRCKILNWLKEGDEIVVEDWMAYQFMEAFGLAYPASGEVAKERIAYQFEGLIDSQIRFRADPNAVDQLVGEIRSLSGRPPTPEELQAKFRGTRFQITGRGCTGEAYVLRVELREDTNLAATLTVRTPLHFARAVRNGSTTANLSAGSRVPIEPGRRAILVDRLCRNSAIVSLVLQP